MGIDSLGVRCDVYGVVQEAEQLLQNLDAGLQQIDASLSTKDNPHFSTALVKMLTVSRSSEISDDTRVSFRQQFMTSTIEELLGTVVFIEETREEVPGIQLPTQVSQACSRVRDTIRDLAEKGIIEALE